SPTNGKIVSWGGAVTAADLAKFDVEFPTFAGSACAPSPSGACCTVSLCTVVNGVECIGHYLGDNTVCTSNPCIPVGACCTGHLCVLLSEADCGIAAGSYKGTATPCAGGPGNPVTCCPANFNGVNGV